jgi:hypothetical protein
MELGEGRQARWQSKVRPVPRAGKTAHSRMPFRKDDNLEEVMKRLIVSLVSAAGLLVSAAEVRGQDLLVPAGTLLQCTLHEPGFSSATAFVGDPVLCHLKSFQEFGRTVFPRGSMLAGHLEAEKEPGHFVGKGYLKLTFDRVIVPTGDLPLPAKVIAAKGFKVDKQGDIKGKGHATRDVVEWMIPPLWPWKVLMLPARGPRPTLTGEEPLQLRLMDDIVVPRAVAAQFAHPDRPPYASSSTGPSSFLGVQPSQTMQPATAEEQPALDTKGTFVNTGMEVNTTDAKNEPAGRVTALALTSNQVLVVTKYRIDGRVINYRAVNGTEGSVDEAQVNWRKSTELTSGIRSADRPMLVRQTD